MPLNGFDILSVSVTLIVPEWHKVEIHNIIQRIIRNHYNYPSS